LRFLGQVGAGFKGKHEAMRELLNKKQKIEFNLLMLKAGNEI
jgi:hypothetical protein